MTLSLCWDAMSKIGVYVCQELSERTKTTELCIQTAQMRWAKPRIKAM